MFLFKIEALRPENKNIHVNWALNLEMQNIDDVHLPRSLCFS